LVHGASNGEFAGVPVLVTGGGSGIGEAVVSRFLEAGARVLIADISQDAGETAVQRYAQVGADVHFIRADVTDPVAVQSMVARGEELFGGLECAVNVAGGTAQGDVPQELHLVEVEHWDGTMALNLRSMWLCLKAEITSMLAHQVAGRIVNIASLAGMRVSPTSSPAYAVSKAAVIHLTRLAAITYGDRGIRVNAVAPGRTLTPAVARHFEGDTEPPPGHAIPRATLPEEQADAVLFLCSDRASMITGLTIPVDGGWAAR
jgi:NAD(P)-dependent dehydrogenase (short-subunit alcohol dehydrogenase family)